MLEITSTRSADLGWVRFLDDDGPVETGEDLVGDQAMVVRVVPERACRVRLRVLIAVTERLAGVDHHERAITVALR